MACTGIKIMNAWALLITQITVHILIFVIAQILFSVRKGKYDGLDYEGICSEGARVRRDYYKIGAVSITAQIATGIIFVILINIALR